MHNQFCLTWTEIAQPSMNIFLKYYFCWCSCVLYSVIVCWFFSIRCEKNSMYWRIFPYTHQMLFFLLTFVSERQRDSLHNILVYIARRRMARQRIARSCCKMTSCYFYNAHKRLHKNQVNCKRSRGLQNIVF